MSPYGAEWIYGQHAVRAVLERDPAGVLEIWLAADAGGPGARAAESAARNLGLSLKRVRRATLERHLGRVVHQGVAVRYRPASARRPPDFDSVLEHADSGTLLLVLDGVTDPHNLGACLRSAAAAGAAAVIAPRRHAAGLTPAARKVASGAAERVPYIRVPNLAQALSRMAQSGVRIVGTAGDAHHSLYDADLSAPLALVLGSEDLGLRRLTREHCHQLVRVPMAEGVESLNVGVTAGICLFEARRRQRAGGGG